MKKRNHKINAYIGVGSNIDPEDNIYNTLSHLHEHVSITGISTFYRTKPLLGKKQNDYLNGVWQIQTSMSPEDLTFQVLRTIEEKMCRVRTTDKFASRTIDLDLLLFSDSVIKIDGMNIPAPDIYLRPFIAYPLSELDPELILPDTKKPVQAILKSLSKEDLRPERLFTRSLRRKACSWLEESA